MNTSEQTGAVPQGDRQVLSLRSIALNGTAASAATAIDEAGALLVTSGAVDPDYVAAMHDRERSVSTYMGGGLAIPHGTGDARPLIRRSAMSFVRYADPIDWDGQPVRFVVAIAAAGTEHLALLQQVALVFADPERREQLRTATAPEAVIDLLTAPLA